jgi:hypothetical protein
MERRNDVVLQMHDPTSIPVPKARSVKQEVDEHVRIIHPAHAEHDAGMEVGQPESRRLDEAGDEDAKSDYEVGRRHVFHRIQLVLRDLLVGDGPQCREKT